MTRSKEAHAIEVEDKWYNDWVEKNVPDMEGKVAVITGSNSGIGFWAASALAGKGCTVVLACRTEEKAEAAKKEILEKFPDAKIDFIPLDNMDFASVRAFAETFHEKYDRLDVLANNAGVMALPLKESKDGYDIQIQTNHLSHFLLTSLLWEKLVSTEGQGRVIQVSSASHKLGNPRFDRNKLKTGSYNFGNGLLWNFFMPVVFKFKPKGNWLRYGVSKLCNVLFFRELERKIKEKDLESKVISVACHPGVSTTGLQGAAGDSMPQSFLEMNKDNIQSAADGSLPLLMACAGKHVANGDYLGPSGKDEYSGPPTKVQTAKNGQDVKMAKELWEFSEEAVGSKFTI